MNSDKKSNSSMTYRDAGVDIDAGNALVTRIKSVSQRTVRSEVLQGLGGFGALFAVPDRYKEPILVSGTDGVGTKLCLAMDLGVHDSIGIDLVAMCTNDIAVVGAEPLFFLDYYATGKLNLEVAESVITGIGKGCELAGAALVGGETAEMPGMYNGEAYDLAGFCVGIVEKSEILDKSRVEEGDALIALPSSGPHSNGYSLIRKVLTHTKADLMGKCGETTLGEALLKPTTIYNKPLLSLGRKIRLHAMAHITGGGILENLPRALPSHLGAIVNRDSWNLPIAFKWIQEGGNISDAEMVRTFNCGVGMVLVLPQNSVELALQHLRNDKIYGWQMGTVTSKKKGLQLI